MLFVLNFDKIIQKTIVLTQTQFVQVVIAYYSITAQQRMIVSQLIQYINILALIVCPFESFVSIGQDQQRCLMTVLILRHPKICSIIRKCLKTNLILGCLILVLAETKIGQILGIFVNWLAALLPPFSYSCCCKCLSSNNVELVQFPPPKIRKENIV